MVGRWKFRQPAYTGANRCLPCTVVNLGITVLLAAIAGLLVSWAGRSILLSALMAGMVFLIGIGLIYARGYLVPGTPAFSTAYLPQWIKDNLSHDVRLDESTAPDVQALYKLNMLDMTDGQLQITEEIEGAIEAYATDEETVANDRLATMLEIEPDDFWLRSIGGTFRVYVNGKRIGAWPTRRSYYRDMAAAHVLADHIPEWGSFDPVQRANYLAGLRVIDPCPSCEAPAELIYDQCCGNTEIVEVQCSSCASTTLELRAVVPENN